MKRRDTLKTLLIGGLAGTATFATLGCKTETEVEKAALVKNKGYGRIPDDWNQIFIPIGFAHSCVTLEPETHVLYKVSNYYAPESEFGLLWSDPDLAVDWRVPQISVLLSEKDSKLPLFRDLESPFDYD